jgi:probable rRNA maturation factor
MKLSIDIHNASDNDEHPPPAEIERWVSTTLQNRMERAELAVRIVSEAEITQLNADYRNKPVPTNVLSFPADLHPSVDIPLLGDLVICASVVASEADEQHKLHRAHWAHMVVHGTLHLLGYDHIEDQDAVLMESLEVDILNQLNFPNPYIVTPGGMHPKL